MRQRRLPLSRMTLDEHVFRKGFVSLLPTSLVAYSNKHLCILMYLLCVFGHFVDFEWVLQFSNFLFGCQDSCD